jgi:V8-like Glu-specific endopeptidase
VQANHISITHCDAGGNGCGTYQCTSDCCTRLGSSGGGTQEVGPRTDADVDRRRSKPNPREGINPFGARALAPEVPKINASPALLSRAAALAFAPRTIYLTDDRKDWHEVKVAKPEMLDLMGATVALFRAAHAEVLPSGRVRLKTATMKQRFNLCEGEKFPDQRTGAHCSGLLIASDLVLTAGHCLQEVSRLSSDPSVAETAFVFGYRLESKGTIGEVDVPADQVRRGRVLVDSNFAGRNQPDWAIVRLDEPVAPSVASPWPKISTADLTVEREVFSVGYPSGMPVKYAPGAKITDASNPHFYTATLDVFGGNSGGGVFDSTTQALVGLVLRGGPDYADDEAHNCRVAFVCPKSGCGGERVLRISAVRLPKR